MHTKPIIQVSNLVKRYPKSKTNAVDDISFYVKNGDFFALLGPNGAGKTTTMSILTTMRSPTSGDARVAGLDIQKHPAKVRQKIGVIFQSPSLDANLTAEENVRFHVNLYGQYAFRPSFSLMPKAYKRRLKQLAAVLDIKDDIFKPIKTFSGGMKRKLEIIRGLMHHPRVLFLDEPTTGLDPVSRQSLWKYLQQVRKQDKTTIFLTTHYLEEAEAADQVCIINQGRIVSFGTPEKIKNELTQEYIVVDANNRNKLKSELTKLRVKFSHNPPFKVNIQKSTPQKIISSLKTPLTTLKIHSPSLEEAYLNIISSTK